MAPERTEPCCVKSIFKEYLGQRKAILKALTESNDELRLYGITLSRDMLESSEWLPDVAACSDSWLMSIAFYHAVRHLSKHRRKKLFNLITELPTVCDVVCPKEPIEDTEDEEQHNAQMKKSMMHKMRRGRPQTEGLNV